MLPRQEDRSTPDPARDPLAIPSIPNLRDTGGLPTRSGRATRTGLLYRASGLHRVAPDDAAAFGRLGVRTVYDLRMAREQAQEPDRLPPGTRHVPVDVLGSWGEAGPARLFEWFHDPVAARAGLGDGAGEALWIDQYRSFVRLPSAREAYGRVVRHLATAASRPGLVHCTTGKDRTGWIVAVVQLLAGAEERAVMDHYLASRDHLEPLVRPVLDAFAARGGDPELFRPVFDVRAVYLEAALDEALGTYGSIEAYAEVGLGVGARLLAELREAFVG